jgi:signal transduction histidine kinase/CheY-like chemotaxis protein
MVWHDWADYLVLVVIAAALVGGAVALLRRLGVRQGLPTWTVASVAMVVLAAIVLAERAQVRTRDSMRAQVSSLGPTFVYGLIDCGYLAMDLTTPGDDPTYLHLIDMQKQWLRINPSVGDVYTFAKNERGEVCLLLDSETDYDRNGVLEGDREARTPIGEVYEDEGEALERAFAGEAAFDEQPYTDRWGTWVSANYPVLRPDGTVHSVLGIDFPAATWLSTIASARRESLAYGAMLIAILVGAGATMRLLQRSIADAEERERLIMAREEEAQAASKAKGEFLANVSHELRTPLTAIVGYADLMLSPGESPSVEHVRTIRRNGAQLLEMINDLLDMAKLESGKFTVESMPTDAWGVARDVVAMLALRAREKGLELRLAADGELPETISSDRTRLRQVLINLVGNAIKFTPKGSVTVRIAFVAHAESRDSGGLLRFDVIDTGVGMTAAQVARLFLPFEQADASTTRRFGGTGLGLAISRELARRLGGDIEVRSEFGAGSTFSVRVATGPLVGIAMRRPAEELSGPDRIAEASRADEGAAPMARDVSPAGGSTPAAHSGATAGRALESARILLAEDALDNQRLLAMFLTKAGASVEVVGDGAAAVATAWAAQQRGGAFDLVLMDMQMPVLDGASATRELRERGYAGVIVALTAHTGRGERERVLGAGCNEHLTKPVDRAALVEACARLIATRSAGLAA